MMKMSKWIVQQNKPQVQARLMNGLGISSVLANLLINRGYTELDAARAVSYKHLTLPTIYSH